MSYVAAYLKLSSTELWEKVRIAEEMLKECTLCPRNCKVDRTSGNTGFCKTRDNPLVASWSPHFGEERPLVGRFGSGTIFFSRCNLGCIFCQNWGISHSGEGDEVSHERLAEIMIKMQAKRCHNINLVTPTHQMPMILHSIAIASEKGLKIPIVFNCGGYESIEALRVLDGIVDIYMPDFKYLNPEAALKYSKAEDYPEAVKVAIKEMHRQVGDLIIKNGIALRGLLVRHLVLPEETAWTGEIVKFIAEEISKETYMNIMVQYYPSYKAFECPPLDRRITAKEYNEAIAMALNAGLKRIDSKTEASALYAAMKWL
ncbi:radical SAM protein [Thermodesulfovibrionales bacterium]|nr:radical SAM protein [Thermodesulfovibrionales bacterium]